MEDHLSSNTIVIDRPKGSAHPRYPNLIYPFDYRYIKDTTAADGEGIDIWVGSLPKYNHINHDGSAPMAESTFSG